MAETRLGRRRRRRLLNRTRLRHVLTRMLDEQELFLAGNGVRSLSRHQLAAPYQYHAAEASFGAAYVTGESDSDMFGGSSN